MLYDLDKMFRYILLVFHTNISLDARVLRGLSLPELRQRNDVVLGHYLKLQPEGWKLKSKSALSPEKLSDEDKRIAEYNGDFSFISEQKETILLNQKNQKEKILKENLLNPGIVDIVKDSTHWLYSKLYHPLIEYYEAKSREFKNGGFFHNHPWKYCPDDRKLRQTLMSNINFKRIDEQITEWNTLELEERYADCWLLIDHVRKDNVASLYGHRFIISRNIITNNIITSPPPYHNSGTDTTAYNSTDTTAYNSTATIAYNSTATIAYNSTATIAYNRNTSPPAFTAIYTAIDVELKEERKEKDHPHPSLHYIHSTDGNGKFELHKDAALIIAHKWNHNKLHNKLHIEEEKKLHIEEEKKDFKDRIERCESYLKSTWNPNDSLTHDEMNNEIWKAYMMLHHQEKEHIQEKEGHHQLHHNVTLVARPHNVTSVGESTSAARPASHTSSISLGLPASSNQAIMFDQSEILAFDQILAEDNEKNLGTLLKQEQEKRSKATGSGIAAGTAGTRESGKAEAMKLHGIPNKTKPNIIFIMLDMLSSREVLQHFPKTIAYLAERGAGKQYYDGEKQGLKKKYETDFVDNFNVVGSNSPTNQYPMAHGRIFPAYPGLNITESEIKRDKDIWDTNESKLHHIINIAKRYGYKTFTGCDCTLHTRYQACYCMSYWLYPAEFTVQYSSRTWDRMNGWCTTNSNSQSKIPAWESAYEIDVLSFDKQYEDTPDELDDLEFDNTTTSSTRKKDHRSKGMPLKSEGAQKNSTAVSPIAVVSPLVKTLNIFKNSSITSYPYKKLRSVTSGSARIEQLERFTNYLLSQNKLLSNNSYYSNNNSHYSNNNDSHYSINNNSYSSFFIPENSHKINWMETPFLEEHKALGKHYFHSDQKKQEENLKKAPIGWQLKYSADKTTIQKQTPHVMMDDISDFFDIFKDQPKFAVAFFDQGHILFHPSIFPGASVVNSLDAPLRDWLHELMQKHPNTNLVICSDHGTLPQVDPYVEIASFHHRNPVLIFRLADQSGAEDQSGDQESGKRDTTQDATLVEKKHEHDVSLANRLRLEIAALSARQALSPFHVYDVMYALITGESATKGRIMKRTETKELEPIGKTQTRATTKRYKRPTHKTQPYGPVGDTPSITDLSGKSHLFHFLRTEQTVPEEWSFDSIRNFQWPEETKKVFCDGIDQEIRRRKYGTALRTFQMYENNGQLPPTDLKLLVDTLDQTCDVDVVTGLIGKEIPRPPAGNPIAGPTDQVSTPPGYHQSSKPSLCKIVKSSGALVRSGQTRDNFNRLKLGYEENYAVQAVASYDVPVLDYNGKTTMRNYQYSATINMRDGAASVFHLLELTTYGQYLKCFKRHAPDMSNNFLKNNGLSPAFCKCRLSDEELWAGSGGWM